MQRLEQAVAQFSRSRPAEHPSADATGELPLELRADAKPELSESLDQLNRNIGASMSAYSGVLKQAAHAYDTSEHGSLFDPTRRAADRAEMIASH
jgi:hypothetical protein